MRLPRSALFFVALISATSIAAAQSPASEPDPKYRITPTLDSASPPRPRIPPNLDSALVELDHMLSPALIAEFRADSTAPVTYHFGLGMWLRNNWGLWQNSTLAKYFHCLGIFHPDDMSGIVLTSYWRRLNGRPLDLERQVAGYQEYWLRNGADSTTVRPRCDRPA